MRQVPLSVKDKVTAKVNELLEKDIIEKVEGPTVWVSPVVVAPKPSGTLDYVSICGKPLFGKDCQYQP